MRSRERLGKEGNGLNFMIIAIMEGLKWANN